MDLLRLAVNDSRVSYIHIISGQDILVKDYKDFEECFGNTRKIYMNCISVKEAPESIVRRFERWVPYLNVDIRKLPIRFLKGLVYIFEMAFHIKRTKLGGFGNIYYGLVYCSFPLSVGQYILSCCDAHSKFIRDLMHTVIPEEFFFQTIIMNSKYAEDVIPVNLQYHDWNYRNGSAPAYLDETDYEKILKSGKFFARKIDLEISKRLLEKLKGNFK